MPGLATGLAVVGVAVMGRKASIPVLLGSLAPILVLHFLWDPPDNRCGSALTDLATFLFCRLVGFAHREGVPQRLKPFAVVALSLAAPAYGAWYAFAHQAETGSYDLDDIPVAQTFYSAGFVTLLMCFKTYYDVDFAWPARFRRTDPDRDDPQRPRGDRLPLARDRPRAGRPADRPSRGPDKGR